MYELLMGHDRWIADLRPLIDERLQALGESYGLCCHPYDICTELIGREAGMIITDENSQPLAAPLDVTTKIAWVGYANQHIYQLVAPVLKSLLVQKGLVRRAVKQDAEKEQTHDVAL